MPGARTGESDEPSTRRRGHLLLVAGVILALGAAGALVLTDDLRWLRLGIVAGLWAALVGAFIAARYRGQVADRDDRAADLQAVYELELEREIAARREYELQVEAEIRAEVDEQSRRDVADLRDELRTLRQTLENLLGGEVLVERYALAQSTRMRPLQEQQRKRLPAAVNGPSPEPVTEQFSRVTELHPVKPGPRSVPPLPRRADRAERPAWPTPTAAKAHPVDTPDPRVAELPPTVVARFRPPAAEPPPAAPREMPREMEPQRPERPQPPAAGPPDFRPAAEPSRPRMSPAPPGPRRPEPQPERSQSRMSPVQPSRRATEQPAERSRSRLDRLQLPSGEFPSPAVEQPVARMDSAPGGRRRADPPSREFRPAAPEPGPRTPEPWEVAGGRRAEEPARTAWEDRPVAGAPQAQESDRWFAAEAEQAEAGRHSGGRRRRAEPDPQPMRPEPGGRRRAAEEEPGGRRRAAEEESGGRRRRAEETPSWQELATWDPVVKATRGAWTPADGSHARGEEGSHATGHSVADLLAQHGTENPRRRRRRED